MATIGTLAAGVAHEINTPIAFVGSNLGRLRELRGTGAGDVRNGDAHEILADCREGVDRISAIVSDLLDLARRDETVVKSVELDYIIESALPMVRAEARDRAELVSQLGEVPRVIGDERQLGQIVINLVMNALQSIAPGRPGENRVTVTTRRVGDRVELRVCDTGPGIPDDVRPHIFDPFFTTKASEGTGLGLAVTQQLVGRHRGQITIESSENGTTAIVSLPVESR
jgi:signal transduction histidine kinase